jgi:hypothetical protein
VIEAKIDRNGHNSLKNTARLCAEKSSVDHSSKMAKTLELVHPHETLTVPFRTLVMKCNLFADDPMLAGAPYSVQAPVSVDNFHQFVSALANQPVAVTVAHFGGLSLLCDEFRFTALSERLPANRQSPDLKAAMDDSEARLRLSAREERLPQRDHDFAALRQAQESTAAALTDAIVRPSRIEAEFAHAQSVSPPKAAATPRVCRASPNNTALGEGGRSSASSARSGANSSSRPSARCHSSTRFSDHSGLS